MTKLDAELRQRLNGGDTMWDVTRWWLDARQQLNDGDQQFTTTEMGMLVFAASEWVDTTTREEWLASVERDLCRSTLSNAP